MCIITRTTVIPGGCREPISKHFLLATETVPCLKRIVEAQASRGSTERSPAANTQADFPFCPPTECTVVDSFSSKGFMVRYRAATEMSCSICLGEMTQTQAVAGSHDALPAQYAILPNGAILKEAGRPDLDLAHTPFYRPRGNFSYDPYYYRKILHPEGFWPVWNRGCMIEHEQKERRVTMNEQVGLQLMLNQIQKYKDKTKGNLRAWNQELLPDLPGAASFEEDSTGNFHLRGGIQTRKA